MKYRRIILIVFCVVLSADLAGCSAWGVKNQGINSEWISLSSNSSLGQTFVTDYSGLQAVEMYLAPDQAGVGTITLQIRSDPESIIELATANVSIEEVTSDRYYRFSFPELKTLNRQYYYALLTIDGAGSVKAGSGPADAYQEGSAYQNQTPIEAQLSFTLVYDRFTAIVSILTDLLRWVLLLIAFTLLFTITGWAFLSWLWKGWKELPWSVKLPLSIGISLAIYTLFALATYLIHIQLGRWYVWFPFIFGIFVLGWRNRQTIVKPKSVFAFMRHIDGKSKEGRSSFWIGISLLITLCLLIFARFWAMYGLEGPMWNDSLHHTEITQLIVDHQGLFSSWLPYAPYKTFSMHFGFPFNSALLKWMTGLSSSQAVLYTGQFISIFSALALYPIALRFTHGNQVSGVVAVLAAGLLSPMPAYYINWGRYAQLAGQVILPISIWMIWDTIDSLPKENGSRKWYHLPWKKMMITAAVIAGMLLYEFRMVFVISTFVIALSIGQLIKYSRQSSRLWVNELIALVLMGILSAIFFLPWGIQSVQSNLINYISLNSSTSSLFSLIKEDYKTWLNIRFYLPAGLIILSLLGWLWAVLRREWQVISLIFWVVLMALLYSLVYLRIPWVQYVQSFAVLISLYIPAGLLLGYFARRLISLLAKWEYGNKSIIALIIILGVWGVWNQRNIATPGTYAFLTEPDIRAMRWIQDNTPLDSKFLVEGTHENWVTNIIGTDAGWWIPLLAHRKNTMPPQYAIANEIPINKDFSQNLITLESKLEQISLASPEALSLLCESKITHVYIGQKQGMVGSRIKPLFTPADLTASPNYTQIYHQDRVYIYSVEAACGQ